MEFPDPINEFPEFDVPFKIFVKILVLLLIVMLPCPPPPFDMLFSIDIDMFVDMFSLLELALSASDFPPIGLIFLIIAATLVGRLVWLLEEEENACFLALGGISTVLSVLTVLEPVRCAR